MDVQLSVAEENNLLADSPHPPPLEALPPAEPLPPAESSSMEPEADIHPVEPTPSSAEPSQPGAGKCPSLPPENACVWPGCTIRRVVNMRVHVMGKHAPSCLKPLGRSTRRQARRHLRILEQLAVACMGEGTTLQALMIRVNRERAQTRGTPHSSQGSMPKVYDAHFHMDRLRQGLGVSFMANLGDLERAEPPRGDVRPVSVAGGIAVYCDPQTYPTTREINFITRDLHLNVAVGVHPKQSLTSDQFDRLHSLSRMSEVKVLGEIGLDHSRPPSDWYRQEGLFRRVLNRCYSHHQHRVVCLHLRGMAGDPTAEECYSRALDILRLSRIPREQRLLLHNYTSTVSIADAYRRHFPATYFSFSLAASGFNSQQRQACRHIEAMDDRRLLIESDGPHFAPAGQRVGAPHLLWATAAVVGEVLGRDPRRVLDLTWKNGRDLF
ncbi:uncharacterized protein LOC117111747 [Anneissia japonica]|uniref:uncharacterized protein LOC117111747 n=1 Tax=Anneissia japonica TaxID=1529436 RepID=UPI001425BB7D|nr:uncharacterized protein LOC117111747 [Anneissia japonica]